MEKTLTITSGLALILITLCSCSTMQSSDHRQVVCNELKNKLMFSGATSNTRRAEIQNSEDALLQLQYDKNGCDELA